MRNFLKFFGDFSRKFRVNFLAKFTDFLSVAKINSSVFVAKKSVIFLSKNLLLFAVILSFAACGNEADFSENCDLNKQDCAVNFKGQSVKFAFATKPIVAMMPTTLSISGLSGDFEDLSVEIYGINMNMGRVKAALQKRGDAYTASITMSACVSQMHYRIELFEKGKALGISADFLM